MKNIYYYDTKLGKIAIAEENQFITDLFFDSEKIPKSAILNESETIKEAAKQLFEYISGNRKQFILKLNPEGTEFQKKDWKALERIPYGEIATYGQIAKEIGCPKGARAVGLANNRNPISIFIPCHRVVGFDGKLVGYGGGIDKKIMLLQLEGFKIEGCKIIK